MLTEALLNPQKYRPGELINGARLQDTQSINKNELCFHMLAMTDGKMKFKTTAVYNGITDHEMLRNKSYKVCVIST